MASDSTGFSVLDAVKLVEDFSFENFYYNSQGKDVLKELEKREQGESSFFDMYSDIEMKIIMDNLDLFSMVLLGVLKREHPYQIWPKSLIFKEIQFLDIHGGQKVADVGAGSGALSILLGVIYEDIELCVNEIDASKIGVVNEKIKRTQSLNATNVFTTKIGNKFSCGFEGLDLDKIILRYTFHHFSEKKKMLESLKKSLAPTGELILIEDVDKHSNQVFIKASCPQAMKKRNIKKKLRKAGFELVEEYDYLNNSFFKYKIR